MIEPLPTRDHTERMLRAAGVDVRHVDHTVLVTGGARPAPLDLEVPGDMSSAAFFLTAAVLSGGEIAVGNVNLNPTRAGFLDVLRRMGAIVEVTDRHEEAGEPVGTVRVSGHASMPIELSAADIPLLVDEVPLVALLATQAEGRSSIRGAQELRVKESDRITAVAEGLTALGATVRETRRRI